MANYANLKATINANIKANGNEEITGPILNTVLNQAVTTLGAGYQYMGVATPATSPGTPDANVFYIAATPGTYTNFGGKVVADGEVAILKYNGSWTKEVSGAATAAQVTQLGQEVEEISGVTFTNSFKATGVIGNLQNPLREGDVITSFTGANWFIIYESAQDNTGKTIRASDLPYTCEKDFVRAQSYASGSPDTTMTVHRAGELDDIDERLSEAQKSIVRVGGLSLVELIDTGLLSFSPGTFYFNGAEAPSTTTIRCNGAFSPKEIGMLSLPDGYVIHEVLLYSAWNSDSDFSFTESISVGEQTFTFPEDATLVRFSIKNTGGTSLAVNTFIAAVPSITPKVVKVKDELIRFSGDRVGFEYGGISSTNGGLVTNTIRARSLPIPVTLLGEVSIGVKVPNSFIEKVHYAYLGSTPVRSITENMVFSDGIATFIADGTFDNIRISYAIANDAEIPQSDINGSVVFCSLYDKVNSISKDDAPYNGLKYCALGDSITYGFIPRNAPGYPGQLDSFAKLAADKLKMSFYNYGISGSTLAYHVSRNPMCVRYSEMPDDADVISFMGGTNDIRNGISLGSFSDRSYTTFYGALHTLIQGLYTKYIGGVSPADGKKRKIIALTPIKLLNPSKSSLPNTIANNATVLEDFRPWADAVKEVSAFYSIPCLDFYDLSGINPHLDRTVVGTEEEYTGNYNPYITDGTHPTQEGAYIMSEVFAGFLKGLR